MALNDDNGNLRANTPQHWWYEYDDENRLVNWYYSTTGADPSGGPTGDSDRRAQFIYDGLGRLRKRVDYTADSGEWVYTGETRYIYDGMRVIQERNGGNTPTVSYTRGSDLSGTLEGAGGIGGLLARSHGYSSGNWNTNNFHHADGNGNVAYLVNTNQTLAASYRYDPFGATISSSGTLASANVYRFSSKELYTFYQNPIDRSIPLYYYGYRFYNPDQQRWINRDPLGEPGFEAPRRERFDPIGDGPNFYLFVANEPISSVDPQGLDACAPKLSCPPSPTTPPMPALVPPVSKPPVIKPPVVEPPTGFWPKVAPACRFLSKALNRVSPYLMLLELKDTPDNPPPPVLFPPRGKCNLIKQSSTDCYYQCNPPPPFGNPWVRPRSDFPDGKCPSTLDVL